MDVFIGVGHGTRHPQAYMRALASAQHKAIVGGDNPFDECLEEGSDPVNAPGGGYDVTVTLTCQHVD